MRPIGRQSALEAKPEPRPAGPADREQISNLIFFETHVHKHLDWKAPLDWLGFSPFVVLQEGPRLSGALACPPDPESIAWLRLFLFSSHLTGSAAWELMWTGAKQQLEAQGGATAAAIATQRWLDPILLENGFEEVSHIVLLEMNTEKAAVLRKQSLPAGLAIRPMLAQDLGQVVEVDTAAFEPLWRNSLSALTNAYEQASYATVAEVGSNLVGYQLSTGGPMGTHLARLAVSPSAQRNGLGAALVQDLILNIPRGREPRLTVNTQSSNIASHALYERMGFKKTGERFPVYALKVEAARAKPRKHGVPA